MTPFRLQVKDQVRGVEFAVTVNPPAVPDEALDRLRPLVAEAVAQARDVGLTRHPDDAALGLAVLSAEAEMAERLRPSPVHKPRRRHVPAVQATLWETAP